MLYLHKIITTLSGEEKTRATELMDKLRDFGELTPSEQQEIAQMLDGRLGGIKNLFTFNTKNPKKL